MSEIDKKADLAGPGIGNYEDLEKVLPQDYNSLLTPRRPWAPCSRPRTTSRRTSARN